MRELVVLVWDVAQRARGLLVLTAVLSFGAGILESEACRLRTIYLDGPRQAVLEDVKDLLEGLGPTSTVLCRRGVLIQRARQACRVRDVNLRKRLPHEVYLYIEPREPAAALSTPTRPDWYMLADSSGLVYESVGAPPSRVVQLHAFPADCLGVGCQLGEQAAQVYADVMAGLEKGGARIRKVDFQDLANVVAFLEDGTKAKIGGMDNLERKFALLGWIADEIERQRMRAQYIDVRIPSQPAILPREARTPAGQS